MSGSWLWARFPWRAAASLLPHRITIFALHRFRSPDRGVSGHAPESLAAALEFLRRERIPLLDLDRCVRTALDGGSLPGRAVVFTVDDGYAEFPEVALPVFQAYDCPVTLFLPTGFIDRAYWFWWDRLEYAILRTDRREARVEVDGTTFTVRSGSPEERRDSVRRLLALIGLPHDVKLRVFAGLEAELGVEIPEAAPPQYAPTSWDQLRTAAKSGLTCGPHTVTHPILWTIPADMMQREIADSIARVRTAVPEGHTDIFAYPQGCVSSREVDFLARLGCTAALLSSGGAVRLRNGLSGAASRFLIPRAGFEDAAFRHRQVITGVESLKQGARSLLGRAESPWPGRTPDDRPPA